MIPIEMIQHAVHAYSRYKYYRKHFLSHLRVEIIYILLLKEPVHERFVRGETGIDTRRYTLLGAE